MHVQHVSIWARTENAMLYGKEDAKAPAYCIVPEHEQLAPWCNIPRPAFPITPHQYPSGPSMFCANLPILIVVMLASFFSAICRTHGRSISRHHDTRLFGDQRRAWPPRNPRFARVFFSIRHYSVASVVAFAKQPSFPATPKALIRQPRA